MSRTQTPILLVAFALGGCQEEPKSPSDSTVTAPGSICERGAAYEAQCNDNPDLDVATCEGALDTCSPEEVDAIDAFLSCLEGEGCDGGMSCFSLFPSVSDSCAQALDPGAAGTPPTTPGGSGIWMPVVDDDLGTGDLNDVFFVDTTTGWVVGDQGLFNTRDGGLTWNPDATLGSEGYQAIDFANADHGWVAADGVSLYRTDDGGSSWAPVEIADELYHRGYESWQSTSNLSEVVAIDAVDADTAWVLFFSGSVIVTDDGGLSWEFAHGTALGRGDIQALDADTYWALGGTMLTASTDGGATASYLSSVPNKGLHFIDATHGWLVGVHWNADLDFASPSIHATTDGLGFAEQFVDDSSGSFEDVHFVSPSTGWVVGQANGFPIVVGTTDGGATWTHAAMPELDLPVTLNAITAVDEDHAWAVGDRGTLLRLTR